MFYIDQTVQEKNCPVSLGNFHCLTVWNLVNQGLPFLVSVIMDFTTSEILLFL